MQQARTKQRISTIAVAARVDDHDRRIGDLEVRLNKYDTIIARLDTLIDVLTKRIETTAEKADNAIEGQELINERNEGTHRWSTATIAIASSLISSILMFVLGHVIH
jgi:hypothetical protein